MKPSPELALRYKDVQDREKLKLKPSFLMAIPIDGDWH